MLNPDTQPLTVSTTPHSQKKRSGTDILSFKVVVTGLLVFLGISYILAQTTTFGRHLTSHLPHLITDKMSGKRTVGYFVSCFILELTIEHA